MIFNFSCFWSQQLATSSNSKEVYLIFGFIYNEIKCESLILYLNAFFIGQPVELTDANLSLYASSLRKETTTSFYTMQFSELKPHKTLFISRWTYIEYCWPWSRTNCGSWGLFYPSSILVFVCCVYFLLSKVWRKLLNEFWTTLDVKVMHPNNCQSTKIFKKQ